MLVCIAWLLYKLERQFKSASHDAFQCSSDTETPLSHTGKERMTLGPDRVWIILRLDDRWSQFVDRHANSSVCRYDRLAYGFTRCLWVRTDRAHDLFAISEVDERRPVL